MSALKFFVILNILLEFQNLQQFQFVNHDSQASPLGHLRMAPPLERKFGSLTIIPGFIFFKNWFLEFEM